MKFLVPLKRVPDPDTRIRVKGDGTGLETDGVKFAINPFDAIALEEADAVSQPMQQHLGDVGLHRADEFNAVGLGVCTSDCNL